MAIPPSESHPFLGWLRRVLRMFWIAIIKFFEIDGEQRAASFAYYAFFALFPQFGQGRIWRTSLMGIRLSKRSPHASHLYS